ncbi:MAG: tRNA pseudouridine(55) synthase TruB [Burkholderiales bacterium]
MSARREINAVLLLDKPRGISSNGALTRAKHLFDAAKAGHCGTLDPLATGLLPIAFGEATKFSRFMLDAEKSYEATLRLGETTPSGDCESAITLRSEVTCTEPDIKKTLLSFAGEQTQIPPMFSALKKNGAPLYALARAGHEVERAPRGITISNIRLLEWSGQEASIKVSCSKGTYIRVLAHDIGEALGCGAHLTALRRTQVGPLSLESAHSLEEIENSEARDSFLLPLDTFISGLAKVTLDSSQALRLFRGQTVAALTPTGLLRCYDDAGRFLGVGTADESGEIRASRLMRIA